MSEAHLPFESILNLYATLNISVLHQNFSIMANDVSDITTWCTSKDNLSKLLVTAALK